MKRLLIFILCVIASLQINAQTQFDTFKYQGKIGTSSIVLNFYIPSTMYNFDQGDYYYVKTKKIIKFAGSMPDLDASQQKLYESVNGNKTGYFIFDAPDYFLLDIVGQQTITGKWFSMDGTKSHNVILNKIN